MTGRGSVEGVQIVVNVTTHMDEWKGEKVTSAGVREGGRD